VPEELIARALAWGTLGLRSRSFGKNGKPSHYLGKTNQIGRTSVGRPREVAFFTRPLLAESSDEARNKGPQRGRYRCLSRLSRN